MRTMAESYFRYGWKDNHTEVILAPDLVLVLFLDGSAVLYGRFIILYETCWLEDQMSPVREPSFVDFYE